MGYSAARGGLDAILAAEELMRAKRDGGSSPALGIDQLTERLNLAVDRVMGEAGLWAPQFAALALRQAEGDIIEAAHLLRAYRSTRMRLAEPVTVHADELEILRRIVPAYRVPPGPQLLGRTLDYVGRLLEVADARSGPRPADPPALAGPEPSAPPPEAPELPELPELPKLPAASAAATAQTVRHPGRLLDLLRSQGMIRDRRRPDDPEPHDVTRDPVRPGVPRSARLSVMARAETGALVNLWYRNVLGPDGYIHEVTLGEVRHGRLPVRVMHPVTLQPVCLGAVRVTEVEAIEDLDGADEERGLFDVGYGLCLGHNERKAIAMANLDIAVERDGGRSSLEQSVLMTTDGLDASGFLEHLKLPHYVTFRSMVDRKAAIRAAARQRAAQAADQASEASEAGQTSAAGTAAAVNR
ncbi:MAG TPA: carbon-phosphorus lyase complex subunit PhnI [Streptosporangiaceae bacterium]|nr:carbon-phosphorus lyase complex subunit PhnI [Streptosporangiaceae bacterium]